MVRAMAAQADVAAHILASVHEPLLVLLDPARVVSVSQLSKSLSFPQD
jgi:hypothetical protein